MGSAAGEGNLSHSDHHSDHNQKDLGNGAPHGTDGPTHANKTTGQDDRWLRSVVENTSEIVTIVDPDGTLRYANPAWERALGYDPDEAIGTMNVLDHVHPDDLAHVLEETEEALADGGITTNEAEYRFRRKDGSWRWMESVGIYLLEDPVVGGVLVVSRDVTERKEAEWMLRRSEAEIFSILESITDGFFALDHELRFTYVNPQAEIMLNRSREDLVGERIWEDPTFYPQYRKALAEGKTVEFEGNYPPREAWYDVRAYPSGSGLSVYFQDVTGRKEAEEELDALRREYEELVGSVEAIIWKGEAQTLRFTFVSDQAEAILGYPAQRWTEEPSFWSDHIHPEDRDWAVSFCRKAVEKKEDLDFEYRMISADGSVVWLRDIVRVGIEDGVPTQLFGVMVDITERKEAEKAVEQLGHRNQLILDSAGEGIYGLDWDGRTTFVNPAAAALTGYEPEDMIGRDQHEVIHHSRPDGTPYPREECPIHAAIWDGEVRQEVDEVFWRKDGTSFPVEYTSTPILEDDEVVGTVVTFTDVTERRRAEEALKESEERYRALMEQSVEAIYLFDAQTKRILESNAAFRRLMGYAEEELLGMRIYDFIDHDDQDIDRHVGRSLEQKRRHIGERRYRRRDGSVILVDTSASVTSYGGRTALCAVSRDVTERREAEEAVRRSEARLTEAQRLAHLGGWEWDVRTGEISWSDEIYRIYGLPPQSLVPSYEGFMEVVHPDDRGLIEGAIDDALNDHRPYDLEHRIVRPDGEVRWVHRRAEVVRGEGGEPLRMIGTVHDITERKEAEVRLREAEERYRTVVEEQTELVCRFLPDLTLTFVNDAYRRYFEVEPEEVIGESFIERVPVEDRVYYEELPAWLNEENPSKTVEHRVLMPDGEVRWQQWTDTAIFDGEGRIVEYQSVGRDVTERKALEEQLRHQAFHDPLTELPNRALFVDRLGHALARSERAGKPSAVLFVDLDNFKVVNDSLDHQAGDYVLKEVAERLRSCIRAGDTAARLFGDEFAVLLEAPIASDDVRLITERIQGRLQEPFAVDGREVFVGASIGIATGEFDRDTAKDWAEYVLRRADLAMYVAKRRGKNRYEVFSPSMDARVSERMKLETDLRRAIEREEFEVRYEPIIALESGSIEGFEALARWRHPERGLLAAEEFVWLAEETGLIRSVGLRIFEEACRQARRCNEGRRDDPLLMGVNFSASQFAHQADMIPKILNETGLDPHVLIIEITERTVMEDADFALGKLRRLKNLGIGFAIDDYGTGYSCLRYLKLMPLEYLKIDRSFVAGLSMEPGDEAIVAGTIDLAHALNLKVVAEGVETIDQLQRLKALKCDLVQGFYFSEPLAGGEIQGLLTGDHRRKPDA